MSSGAQYLKYGEKRVRITRSLYTDMNIAIRNLIQNFWRFKRGMSFFNSILTKSNFDKRRLVHNIWNAQFRSDRIPCNPFEVQQSHHGFGFDGLHEDEVDVEKSRWRYSRSKRVVALSLLCRCFVVALSMLKPSPTKSACVFLLVLWVFLWVLWNLECLWLYTKQANSIQTFLSDSKSACLFLSVLWNLNRLRVHVCFLRVLFVFSIRF